MKKTMTFILLLAINFANAQVLNELDQMQRENDDIHLYSLVNSNASGFYSLSMRSRGKGTDLYIEKFNTKGQVLFSKQVTNYYYALVAPKGIYVLRVYYDAASQRKVFEYDLLSGDNGEITESAVIHEFTADAKAEKLKTFSIAMSADYTKMLVISQDQKEGEAQETHLKWYDATTMKLLWKQTLSAQWNGNYYTTSDYKVDNDGNAFITLKYAKELADFKKYNTTSAFAVIASNSKEIAEVKLNGMESLNTVTYKTKITTDGRAILAGIYKDPEIVIDGKRNPRRVGSFFASIDLKTAKMSPAVTSYFSSELEQRLTYKSEGGYSAASKPLVPMQIVEWNNNIYLVAEYAFTTGYATTDGKGGATSCHMEMLVTKFSASGTPAWTKLLPKSASVNASDGYKDATVTASCNYNFLLANNQLNFIYLDNPKNSKKFTVDNFVANDYNTVRGVTGADVVCVSLDEAGNAQKKIIYQNNDFCMIPQIQDVRIDKKTLLVYLRKGNKEKFGTITFQ